MAPGTRMEILAAAWAALMAAHVHQRAGGDTSWDEDDHLDLLPYCACQGRQHVQGRKPGLGTRRE